ncbi:GDP-fucose protein O-fucosyltransferase protein [Dioscorea alata]|uniref:GDP-fucose protein O-fucosyltransferase protein n=1 Tax=Dioscorea alata TaxID=55571 RepID=A0ACB7VWR0_DIOAL|nr:GDP-fucose protein O-fucosyltransferase protein [Dioscorea alata]
MAMNFLSVRHLIVWICFILVFMFLSLKTVIIHQNNGIYSTSSFSNSKYQNSIRKDKFLEVPQIVWGLNNQKIAFARACLTARFLNRSLLMPSLSSSLFYKEIDLLEPISFDKIFQYERFNSLCDGFVHLSRYSELVNDTEQFELRKGSGRKWTKERDMNQLAECSKDSIDKFEVIRIVGKNPFLWHDHWPVVEYAKIFECLAFVEEIQNEATKVVSKIQEFSFNATSRNFSNTNQSVPYLAVHMRIEKDWMIHCKKLEQRLGINQICSSKQEIMQRVKHIRGVNKPIIVYLAIADSLFDDDSILIGWEEGLIPCEKKKLGVWDVYNKYSYLFRSAIDYEVCLRANVFVGNSFSTFSSLIVFERTEKMIKMGIKRSCDMNVGMASYAYNLKGENFVGPKSWMTDFSALSLESISYGTINISCDSKVL